MTRYVSLQSPDGEVVEIKIGFSWPAFFFGPIWGIFARVWRQLPTMLVAWLGLVLFDDLVVQPSGNLVLIMLMGPLYIGYMYICGKNGNRWVAQNLEKQGFNQIHRSATQPN
jgi:hypothetical protein